jgi:hypothetical protein
VQIWAAREDRVERSEPKPNRVALREPSPAAPATTLVLDETPAVVAVLDRELLVSVSEDAPEEAPVLAVRANRHHRPRHRAATLRTNLLLLMTVGFGTPPR